MTINWAEMTEDAYYKLIEETAKTKLKVLNKLKLLPKNMKVFVYSRSEGKYVNVLYVWEEGHDYRHFIELMPERKYGEPMTVGKLIPKLKECYSKHGRDYANGISVNVTTEDGHSTANFDFIIKNNSLYCIGKTPLYKYSAMYRKSKNA